MACSYTPFYLERLGIMLLSDLPRPGIGPNNQHYISQHVGVVWDIVVCRLLCSLFEMHPTMKEDFVPFKSIDVDDPEYNRILRNHGLRVLNTVSKMVRDRERWRLIVINSATISLCLLSGISSPLWWDYWVGYLGWISGLDIWVGYLGWISGLDIWFLISYGLTKSWCPNSSASSIITHSVWGCCRLHQRGTS